MCLPLISNIFVEQKLARALQKEEQRRSFEVMRRQREELYIQQQRQMYRSSDDEATPDDAYVRCNCDSALES